MDNNDLKDLMRKELNFRGLGGYVMGDGRKIKKGIIYRSGALGECNEEELEYIKGLGLKTVFDFRNDKEREKLPDPVFEGAEHIHSCAAFRSLVEDFDYSPHMLLDLLRDEDHKGNTATKLYSSLTAAIAFTNSAYQQLFEKLQEGAAPLLFHCSGGKDRTGVAAALILLALGAEEETIKQDYMLSNIYLEEYIEDKLDDRKLLVKISDNYKTMVMATKGVIPESVHMLLEEIKEKYETYENFFDKEYGMNESALVRLRDMYLE